MLHEYSLQFLCLHLSSRLFCVSSSYQPLELKPPPELEREREGISSTVKLT